MGEARVSLEKSQIEKKLAVSVGRLRRNEAHQQKALKAVLHKDKNFYQGVASVQLPDDPWVGVGAEPPPPKPMISDSVLASGVTRSVFCCPSCHNHFHSFLQGGRYYTIAAE